MTFVQKMVQVLKRGRVTNQLASLSDRELRDIGITRGDIAFVAHHGRRPQDMPA